MSTCSSRRLNSQAGVTLIEMMVTSASLSVILGGVLMLMMSSRGAVDVAGTQSGLQEVGRRSLDRVISDLRRSGLTTSGGQAYPGIWQRPLAPSDESQRGSLSATMNYGDVDLVDETLAYDGNGDRIERNRDRDSQEIIFQLPGDLDGNGIPIDANGAMEWRPELISYHVEVANNGVPWLMRIREDAGGAISRERVAPWVNKITFDVVYNDRSMRFGAVSVVVYLERRNARRQTIESALEATVVLRNTKEL